MGRQLREIAGMEIALASNIGVPIPYRERYVLLALANALKDNPGHTWTSDARMAAKLGMSPDAYYRARTNLIERGLMVRVDGGGQGASNNRYQLLPSAESAEEASAETAEADCVLSELTSADTPVTSADTADTSLSNPYKPNNNPSPYGAPASLSQHRNRHELVSESSEILAAAPSEDLDGSLRVGVASLRGAR